MGRLRGAKWSWQTGQDRNVAQSARLRLCDDYLSLSSIVRVPGQPGGQLADFELTTGPEGVGQSLAGLCSRRRRPLAGVHRGLPGLRNLKNLGLRQGHSLIYQVWCRGGVAATNWSRQGRDQQKSRILAAFFQFFKSCCNEFDKTVFFLWSMWWIKTWKAKNMSVAVDVGP